jgi:5-formyltetrahydrofolate cyclo-ligase
MHDIKAYYRSRFRAARRAVPESTVAALSHRVAAQVTESALFHAHDTILLYDACDNEVDTGAVRIAADAAGKAVYYPRLGNHDTVLEFVRVAPGERLRPGRWGIGQPTGSERLRRGRPALALIPGVAFDSAGTRLGRGGGYYDQAIRELGSATITVGLALSVQVAPSLPFEAHDVPIHFIATETEVLRCTANRSTASLSATRAG